jgi:hypothetical protein
MFFPPGYIYPHPPFFSFVSTHILSSRVNPTAGLFYAFSRRFIYLIIAEKAEKWKRK